MSRFFANRSGATSIEYAMIAGLIGFLLITALTSMGTSVSDMLTAVLAGFN